VRGSETVTNVVMLLSNLDGCLLVSQLRSQRTSSSCLCGGTARASAGAPPSSEA
jgi:hypothetical protein